MSDPEHHSSRSGSTREAFGRGTRTRTYRDQGMT
jgi:hypothetical protein